MTTPHPLALILSSDARGVLLKLKVVPNASRNRIAGLLGDRLKILVAAPPEDGKANQAVCELLARAMGVSLREVTLAAGHHQPMKTVHVAGLDVTMVQARLAAILGK